MSEKKLPMPTVEDDRCGHLGKECGGDLPGTVCTQFFSASHFVGSLPSFPLGQQTLRFKVDQG